MKKNRITLLEGAGSALFLLLATSILACTGENTTGVDETEVAESALNETEEIIVDAWSEEEFSTTFAAHSFYEEWDGNDDSMLDQNEYNAALYDTWDVNNDNRLEETEWINASRDFGLEAETWSEWDTGGDGALNVIEFTDGLGESSWFGAWDIDNDSLLVEEEYTDGLFDLLNKDGNRVLNEKEYALYDTYYSE